MLLPSESNTKMLLPSESSTSNVIACLSNGALQQWWWKWRWWSVVLHHVATDRYQRHYINAAQEEHLPESNH